LDRAIKKDALVIDGRHRASVEGYEHMDSVMVDDGGRRYKVDVYWDDLHSIPGEHKILARIWSSVSEYKEYRFTSGNRLWLKSIGVRREGSRDELILYCKPMLSPLFKRYESVNTVSETGIHGHPQLVEKD
jgi:hypothetical protein